MPPLAVLSPALQHTAAALLHLTRCGAVLTDLPAFPVQEPDPEKLTPGPGAYSSKQSASTSGRPSSAPVAHAPFFSPPRPRAPRPLFARTTGRSAALGIGPGWSLPPSKQLAPGPGAYNLSPAGPTAADRAVLGSRSFGRAGLQGSGRAPAASGGSAANDTDEECGVAAGFGCTSRRFGDNSTVAPGPGAAVLGSGTRACHGMATHSLVHIQCLGKPSVLQPTCTSSAQHRMACKRKQQCDPCHQMVPNRTGGCCVCVCCMLVLLCRQVHSRPADVDGSRRGQARSSSQETRRFWQRVRRPPAAQQRAG